MRSGSEGDLADLLGLIGFGSFLAVSTLVGIRLLLLARRTRRLPELAVGLDFLLAGSIGYALLLAAESLHLFAEPYSGWASFAAVTAISLGAGFLALFTRRVFRPESRFARAAQGLLFVWLALGVYGSWVLHVSRVSYGIGGWLGTWASMIGGLAVYAWASFEPFYYYAQLRRRARIGIETGDPLVANRMLLWGVGMGAVAAVSLLHLVVQLFGWYELPESLVGVVSTLVLVAAIAEWLAFFPPRAYRKRFVRA
jgi:hypothetical protein